MLTPEKKLLRKQKLDAIRNTPVYRKELNVSNSNSDNTPTPKSINTEHELKTPIPNSKNKCNKISFDFI
jgi:hypothetical protein